jgi:hypothetical protein
MSAMIMLQRRELDFLHESNAIENIVNIDYRDPRNVSVDGGLVGAYIDAQDRAHCRVGLRVIDISRWQRWIVEEQIAHGHAVAPSRVEVPPHVHAVLADLNAHLAVADGLEGVDTAAVIIGEVLHRFAMTQTFEGAGRVARVIASYVATWCALPIVVFRASDRPLLFAAQRGLATMRAYVTERLREASYVSAGNSLRCFAPLGL